MDCDHWQRLISLKHDGMIETSQTADLEAHLPVCESCREFEKFLQTLASSHPPDIAVPQVWESLRHRLSHRQPERNIYPTVRRAALALLALAGTLYFYVRLERLQYQIDALRKENLSLVKEIEIFSKEMQPDAVLIQQAFRYYDQKEWDQSRHWFELLLNNAKEENQTLALYYLACIYAHKGNIDAALDFIHRLLDTAGVSLYIPSIQILLGRLSASAISVDSPDIKRRLEKLWQHTNLLSPNTGKRVLLSY